MKVKSLVLGIDPCAALGAMPLLGQVVTPGLGLLLLCAPNRGVGLGAWGLYPMIADISGRKHRQRF